MLSLVLILVAAASPKASPERTAPAPAPAVVAADGQVVTPDGIRFRLPPRLSYSAKDENGRRSWIARSADGATVVAVTAVLSDTDLPCQVPPGGVQFRAFATAGGLRGCIGTGRADRNPLAFSLAFVKGGGDILVSISAVARADLAEGLALEVASSVDLGAVREGAARTLRRVDALRPDPRLVGCFENRRLLVGQFAMTSRRCFEDDFSFTEEREYILPGGSNIIGRDAGSWLYVNQRLALRPEDGPPTDEEVTFDGEDLLIGGERWRRR